VENPFSDKAQAIIRAAGLEPEYRDIADPKVTKRNTVE
jgi:hypothetical protein